MSGRCRVCVIGAGPCGMSFLYQLGRLEGGDVPEVVCYEKQEDWGGLWNYSWRTGTDEHGERSPWSMYRHLWSNGPKECLEFPDYTFEDHFGHPIPSFPPREVLQDYLKGRWKRNPNIHKLIQFKTVVTKVVFNEDTKDFSVWVKDLIADVERGPEKFDYVVVAVGIFNVPNYPSFPGFDSFPGRILHSHDFRDALEFAGKRMLLVGASYSAEDLALQCLKYGAKDVICTWRTKPMGFRWPKGITERPLLQKVEHKTAYFKDGESAEVDVIILCTGYLYHYPFLSESLRLKSRLSLYPAGLYKGTVFLGGGDNKLLYLGTEDQYYTFTMFDLQALWAVKYITGAFSLPSREDMLAYSKRMVEKVKTLEDCHADIDFQSAFLDEFIKEKVVEYDLRCTEAGPLFHTWEHHKDEDICTYRDKSFASIFTGTQSPVYPTTFMKAFDDSLESFVKKKPTAGAAKK